VDFALAFDHLLAATPEPAPLRSLEDWWAGHRRATAGGHPPGVRALLAGFAADRPGYAFASGLQEALALLIGDAPDRRRAFCATEEGGAHPRAIQTELIPDGDGWHLQGEKRWLSLGSFAEELLVVARLPAEPGDERPRLALVRVPAERAGIAVTDMPPTPFIPEVPHAVATFDAVVIRRSERLPGDGYARYFKPFRTVEDCLVHTALLAWMIQAGRRARWPEEHVEAVATVALGFACLAEADPTSHGVHRLLGGLLARTAELVQKGEDYEALLESETRARWIRDRPLLKVAERARVRRLEVARTRALGSRWARQSDGAGVR